MPENYSVDTQSKLADMRLAFRVVRPTALLTAATVPIFYVYGGNVLMTGFYGEIMVVLDAASVISINMDVDTGAGDTALAANGADANTYVAGRMCYLPAVAGVLTWTAECGACPVNVAPDYVLRPGHIDMVCNGAATLGSMRWTMWYVPVTAGAYVVAG